MCVYHLFQQKPQKIHPVRASLRNNQFTPQSCSIYVYMFTCDSANSLLKNDKNILHVCLWTLQHLYGLFSKNVLWFLKHWFLNLLMGIKPMKIWKQASLQLSCQEITSMMTIPITWFGVVHSKNKLYKGVVVNLPVCTAT